MPSRVLLGPIQPNPLIPKRLEDASYFGDLVARFEVLSEKESYTHVKKWDSLRVLGAFALGLIAAGVYVYQPLYQKASFVLLAAATALSLTSRPTVPVETEKFKKQRQDIQEFFEGIVPELRKTWEVASMIICTKINGISYGHVKDADQDTRELLVKHIQNQNDSDKFSDEVISWIKTFRVLQPLAEKIAKYPIESILKDIKIAPLLRQEFAKVHAESVRLVYGYSPVKDGDHAKIYVNNNQLIKDAKGNDVVVSNPWPATPLIKV